MEGNVRRNALDWGDLTRNPPQREAFCGTSSIRRRVQSYDFMFRFCKSYFTKFTI
ncbi:hypothetical protein OCAR_7392 [Afipia carboxidovorans OM5]|nr:hypothetical protein OCAR_7392 [Afipia carboxidovorans OM5]